MTPDEQNWNAALYDHTSAYELSHAPKPQCGCESSYCAHDAARCTGTPTGARMMYIGEVCNSCAHSVAGYDGASFVTAPFGTWARQE